MALNISTKKTGDKLTATEFNAVVDEINTNGKSITALQQADTNMQTIVDAVQKEQSKQSLAVKTLQAQSVKMVALTQDAYDALASAGTLDAETYYNILEEE